MPARSPLNSIGMPYYDTSLLSLLPGHMTAKHTASHRRVPLDPHVLTSAKTVDFVGYASYPAHLRSVARRNQARSTTTGARTAGRVGIDAPMFRSERERAEAKRRRDYGDEVSCPVRCAAECFASSGGRGVKAHAEFGLSLTTGQDRRGAGGRRERRRQDAQVLPQGRDQVQSIRYRRL